MKFSDFIVPKAIVADAKATDKEGIIREMVQSLADSGAVPAEEFDNIFKAIMKREELGTTGLGRGVAVPHTKHPSVDSLVGTVAVSVDGLDFQAFDGDDVFLFFMLISPPDRPVDHLRALEHITRKLRDDTFLRFLKQSRKAEDIVELLEEADNNQFGG